MGFCVNCGTRLGASDVFCPNCGQKILSSEEELCSDTSCSEESEAYDIIELDDENGNPVRFCFLDRFSFRGSDYIFLMPEDNDSDDDAEELIILQVAVNNGDEKFLSVDDTKLLNILFEKFKQRNSSKFNFV